jgi:hypothetical protein
LNALLLAYVKEPSLFKVLIEIPNIFKYVLTPTLTNTKNREQAKVLRRLMLGAAHLPTNVAQLRSFGCGPVTITYSLVKSLL